LPHIEDSRDIIVGRLGRGSFGKGFSNYALSALKRLNVDLEAFGITEDVLQAFWDRYQDREKEVAICWTLRAMLAEAIESLILVDRVLNLLEVGDGSHPLDISLLPIFDYVESPRNMALIVQKLDGFATEGDNDVTLNSK